uniref:UBP8/5-like ubiquitin-like domain-containing protein n=1 Tax=Aegilops tauschii TaxID=37682 RepID=M8BQS4_AEGTA
MAPPLMQLETLLALNMDQRMAENQAIEDGGFFLCPCESEAVPIGSGRSGERVHEAWMHSDSLKSNGKSSLFTEEADALTVTISTKDNSAVNIKRANKILVLESEPDRAMLNALVCTYQNYHFAKLLVKLHPKPDKFLIGRFY